MQHLRGEKAQPCARDGRESHGEAVYAWYKLDNDMMHATDCGCCGGLGAGEGEEGSGGMGYMQCLHCGETPDCLRSSRPGLLLLILLLIFQTVTHPPTACQPEEVLWGESLGWHRFKVQCSHNDNTHTHHSILICKTSYIAP